MFGGRVREVPKQVTVNESDLKLLMSERGAWEETARIATEGRAYYRGLVIQIGEMFGEAAKTQDDGGKVEDVLCAKVPELVAEELERMGWLERTGVAIKCDFYVPGTKMDRAFYSSRYPQHANRRFECLRDAIDDERRLEREKAHGK